LDDRTRDDHAVINGEKIPIDEKFELPDGTQMDGPGDTSADASQIINCRCTLGFGVT
jgi:hypothetical protein